MDHTDKRTTVNGYPGADDTLPVAKWVADPRRDRGGPLRGDGWAHQRSDDRGNGGNIWRVTYINAGCGSEHGRRTKVSDSESSFGSFLEHLGSSGATVIRVERASVTGWTVQQ
jgi:hypothetical protein